MEYRRSRKRQSKRRRTSSRRAQGGASIGSAVISLLLIAGIVYIVASSNAGEWVATEVMAPMFSALSRLSPGAKASPSPGENADSSPEGGMSTAPMPSPLDAIDLSGEGVATVSAQAVFPAMECYMLQMGVFSSIDNARNEADKLQALGAAGFIVTDDSSGETRYRVMAAGYDTEQGAKGVKERLSGEGIDSALFTLTSPQASFKVTAEENALAGVKSAFSAFSSAQSALSEGVVAFDKESMSIDEGRTLCASVLSAMETDMASLSAYAGQGGALEGMLNAYSDCRAQLMGLCEGDYQSTVDFSAAMKYTHLYITNRYAALVGELAQ